MVSTPYCRRSVSLSHVGSVTWAITVPDGGASLGVDYAPGDGYEAAYWEFALTGQSGPPGGGAPGGPGEVDA